MSDIAPGVATQSAVDASIAQSDVGVEWVECPNCRRKPPSKVSLTDRQIQLLQLAADGRSNIAIARELGLSLDTVKTHMSNIRTRLIANNRTQAVVIAIRGGLVK